MFSYISVFSQFCCGVRNWFMCYLFIIPSYLRGSRYPPNKNWLCDLRPLLCHWGWADHSGWTPQCCGSAWKKHTKKNKHHEVIKRHSERSLFSTLSFFFSHSFRSLKKNLSLKYGRHKFGPPKASDDNWELRVERKISVLCCSFPEENLTEAESEAVCLLLEWAVIGLWPSFLFLGHRTTTAEIRSQAALTVTTGFSRKFIVNFCSELCLSC